MCKSTNCNPPTTRLGIINNLLFFAQNYFANPSNYRPIRPPEQIINLSPFYPLFNVCHLFPPVGIISSTQFRTYFFLPFLSPIIIEIMILPPSFFTQNMWVFFTQTNFFFYKPFFLSLYHLSSCIKFCFLSPQHLA